MCQRRHLIRTGRLVLAASGFALSLFAAAPLTSGGVARAQSVQVFDDAPPIEVLRGILIPESKPGLSRTIVLQKPDLPAPANGIQRTAATIPQSGPIPPEPTQMAAPTRQAAASPDAMPRQAPDPAPQQAPDAAPRTAPDAAPRQATPVRAGTVGLRINFAFNSAELPASAHEAIDRVVAVMKEAPDIKVRVEGHTDAAGGAGYNRSLSEKRALSVAQYLVQQGIEPSRLMLVGKGMAEPLTQNPYDPANRRVQFVRVG